MGSRPANEWRGAAGGKDWDAGQRWYSGTSNECIFFANLCQQMKAADANTCMVWGGATGAFIHTYGRRGGRRRRSERRTRGP
jgi:hypothetical protein